jgi:hypothetical protein
VYDKLKFKRQEEGVLAADCAQLGARLNALTADERGLAGLVDDLTRRKVGAKW